MSLIVVTDVLIDNLPLSACGPTCNPRGPVSLIVIFGVFIDNLRDLLVLDFWFAITFAVDIDNFPSLTACGTTIPAALSDADTFAVDIDNFPSLTGCGFNISFIFWIIGLQSLVYFWIKASFELLFKKR